MNAISRRAVLLGGVGLVAAACGANDASTGQATPSPGVTPTATATVEDQASPEATPTGAPFVFNG
ncbi:MAG: hypothetical protein J2P37_15290, partial [Ktedonobacteraceae bacterium]|nr:hypothetical protein [Ktedonobacteraceae bacterium]